MGKLVACPSCSTYVRVEESSCPHCDTKLRTGGAVARTAGAMLMGLSLTACPAEDDGDDTGASSATMTAGSTSDDPSTAGSTSDDPGTSTGPLPEPAYGVGTTDVPGTTTGGGTDGTSSGGDTDGTSSSTGDIGSTSIGGPEYGVPETTSGA